MIPKGIEGKVRPPQHPVAKCWICSNLFKLEIISVVCFGNEVVFDIVGDRVSSCNVYVVQQDTQCFFMIEFIRHIC